MEPVIVQQMWEGCLCPGALGSEAGPSRAQDTEAAAEDHDDDEYDVDDEEDAVDDEATLEEEEASKLYPFTFHFGRFIP